MILFRLKKKYAKGQMVFEEDLKMDPDGWFIDIKVVSKNGNEKIQSTIIRKDIDNWVSGYVKNGWEIINNE